MSKQRTSHPALLTTREAAAALGVHERTLRRYMSSGLLVYRRLPGGHYRIPEESIRDLWGGEDLSNLDGRRASAAGSFTRLLSCERGPDRFEPGWQGETWVCANHALLAAPTVKVG